MTVDPQALAALRHQSIGRLFHRAARAYGELALVKLHALGYDRLTMVHTSLIANLDLEGTRITTLAERAGVTKQAMGQIVDDLEQRQFIRREPDPADKRATMIRFTDLGWTFLEDAYRVKLEIEAEYAQVLGGDGMETLRSLLQTLLNERKP